GVGHALGPSGAEGAVRLLPAGVGDAHVAGRAVAVRGAAPEALAAVAGEGNARDRVGRDAAAGRAAGGLGCVLVVLAVLGGADRAGLVVPARARAVALSVGAAGRSRL